MTSATPTALHLVTRDDAARLSEEEHLYRQALGRLPTATYTTDPEGRITYCNDAAAQLWGGWPDLGRARWCGSLRLRTLDGQELPPERSPVAQALREQRALPASEVVVERPDGQLRQVLVHPQPMFDSAGRLLGAINVLVDVTELKSVQAQLAATTERLQAEVSTLTTLHELALQLSRLHELGPALQAILEAMVRIHRADFGLLWLADPEHGALQPAASVGFDASARQGLARLMTALQGGAGGRAFRRRERVVVEDVQGDARFDGFRDMAARLGFRAVHSTPIFTRDGATLGVLSVHFRQPRVPTRSEEQLADLCARHAGEIVETHRAREALRASERLYRAIGESIDYGVWIADAEGHYTYVSESFLRLVGRTQSQCLSHGWVKLLHPDEVQPTLAAWRECVAGASQWYRELRFRGVDGQWHPVLSRGVAVRDDDGRVVAWAGIHLDIRRLKEVERELRSAHQRKDEFLATLAHELRNPLAPISNALQVLKRTGEPARAEQARGVMERQLRHMVRLVDDLVDVSRISRGKIELRCELLDLRAVVESAVEAAQPLLLERGHEFVLDLPAHAVRVHGDGTRLAQVFANLLNNAARYTPRHGHVRLSMTEEDALAVVRVRDDGIGIPREMIESVFEMFVQGRSPVSGERSGLGVGLTLVKRLVEMHGGTVQATSEEQRGSEFIVRLPADGGRAEGLPDGEGLERPGPGYRLLIVDDNRDSADTLAMLLELMGHDVRTANDGPQALQVADSFRPHAALLDIGMPGMSGLEVCERLREQPWGRQMVLVAVTGWGQDSDHRRSREAGFDAHLVKPVEPQALQDVLTELERRFPPA